MKLMTREKRILNLINHCERFPYQCTPKELGKKHNLSEALILHLIERLSLEVKGHRFKNVRRELITFFKNNPNQTARMIEIKTGHSLFIIREVAREAGIKLDRGKIKTKSLEFYSQLNKAI